MTTFRDDANEAFLELISAFERFRQAWEKALAEQQRSAKPHAAVPASAPPPDPKKLLTRREAAEYLGVAAQTLAYWQTTRKYSLPIVKVGNSVRYRLADLDRWLSERTEGKHAE